MKIVVQCVTRPSVGQFTDCFGEKTGIMGAQTSPTKRHKPNITPCSGLDKGLFGLPPPPLPPSFVRDANGSGLASSGLPGAHRRWGAAQGHHARWPGLRRAWATHVPRRRGASGCGNFRKLLFLFFLALVPQPAPTQKGNFS